MFAPGCRGSSSRLQGSQRLSLDDLGAHPLALRRICPPAYGEAARPQRGDFLMSDSSTDAPLAPPRLVALGLTSRQAKAARADATRCVGRVAEDRRIHFLLYTEEGQKVGACMPELLRDARKGTALRPVVGDFVVFDPALNEGLVTIIDVLPRESAFIRKRARNEVARQVIASNIDAVFIVTSMTEEFNERRLERYLSLTLEAGAVPVLVLTKPDLCDDPRTFEAQARALADGVACVFLDPRTSEDLGVLSPWLVPGKTLALLGSSGVGKSTLINRLLDRPRQREGEVRKDGKGRHTTTTRHLFESPSGVLLIDTPGMRELGLWDADGGVQETFHDVERFAQSCRFSNCAHDREPGCAVQAAIAEGQLDAGRLEGFQKLTQELRALESERGRRRRGKGGRRSGR